jgi:nicotinamidase-related amidase
MNLRQSLTVAAEPYGFEFVPAKCALLIIDMQRDFLETGGFGEMLGNDVTQLRRTIAPNRKLLAVWRVQGLQVIHTREGHRPDLSDLPQSKGARAQQELTRFRPRGASVRGEAGHDIIPELYPLSMSR